MASFLQTDVSMLSLAQGRRQDLAIGARAIEPDDGLLPGEGKGNLYLLLELEGPEAGRPRLYRELLNTVQETYYRSSEDMAKALTTAIHAAHHRLQASNRAQSTPFTGAITAVAVVGTTIVVAQVGATILAVRSRRGLEWFSPLNQTDRPAPLGGTGVPSVEIGRIEGQTEAVLVAMTGAWANYLEVPLMLEATAVPHAQVVADQLAGIGIDAAEPLMALAVMVREVVEAPPERRPSPLTPPEPAPAPSPPGVMTPPTPASEAPEPAAVPRRGRRIPDPAAAPAVRPRRSLLRAAGPPPRIPYVLPLIGAIVLIILVLTAGMWYLQRQQRARYFADFIRGTTIQLEAAQNTTDENQQRLYLQAAQEQLDQAAVFYPNHPEVAALRNRIAEARARVNRVVSLLAGFDVPLIAFDAATRQPNRVLVSGLSLYILDTRQGLLERYRLDENTGDRLREENPEILVRSGDTIGGRRVGELAFAVWAPAMGNRTVTGPLVLDRGIQLFGVVESLGAVNVALAANPGLGTVTDMQYYIGNLYFLDTANSQVWRYRPSGEGYENAPEPYFQTGLNLSPAIAMAIDGAIWLLHPNGTVLRYFNGVQEPFALDVVDPPIVKAVAIWVNDVDPPDGRIVIGDAGSNRVLVFDKRGRLLGQLMPLNRPGLLERLRSLTVDETNNYLYLLTDNALYQTPFPPLDRAQSGP
jgi:hypothetical protein